MLKRTLALTLAMFTGLGLLTACGSQGGNAAPSTDPVQTGTSQEPKGGLKILTIGHSLAIDSCHMLALIAKTEGYEDMTVGTLYYSGCQIFRHIEFMKNDSREYELYMSSTETPNDIPTMISSITMKEAVAYKDWDIIVLQDGPFQSCYDEYFTNGDIQTLQTFVNENKTNPNAVFAWHMPWALPTDPDLAAGSPYFERYETNFGLDRIKVYEAYTDCAERFILTDDTFQYLIPTATAMQNALTSYLTEKDLHRDYSHASDLGRVIAAYVWYCTLTGVEELQQIKLDTVPKNFFRSLKLTTDWVLTEEEKALILETVNNTLKQPLKVTPSQYTQAPEK